MSTQAMSQREAISERASAIAKDFEDVRSAVNQMATDSVDLLRQTASDLLYDGQDKAQEARKRIETKFQESPVRTVLTGAAIGFLIGVIFRRRNRFRLGRVRYPTPRKHLKVRGTCNHRFECLRLEPCQRGQNPVPGRNQ